MKTKAAARLCIAMLITTSITVVTTAQAAVLLLEAETASLNNAKAATNHPGYTGTGFADYLGEGYIEWTFDVDQPALYQLEFRYALKKGDRPLDIHGTNGVLIKSGVSFPKTGSFNIWNTVSVFAKLEAGQNKIRAVTTGSSGANIDHLLVSLTPPDPKKFLTFPIHTSHGIFPGSQAEAHAYYKTLDPLDLKTTFDTWKLQNNLINCTPPDCAHAVYLNNVDLNFGRSMFVKESSDGTLASYVQNFPSLQDAVQGTHLLATVAMEYAPPVHRFAPDKGQVIAGEAKFTKFYVFNAQGQRVTKVDLDGRGEKHVPGLCNVCHGGKPKPADLAHNNYFDRGDTNAKWIPWDLDTYKFHPTKTRADQEDDFKRLNEMVLLTNPSSATRQLIYGWYGDAGPSLPSPTFNGQFVLPGWRNDGSPVNKEKLYLSVVAPNCRACHNQRGSYDNSGIFYGDPLETSLEFATFERFRYYKKDIDSLIYEQGLMPLAKRTYELFWRSDQPKILDDEFFAGEAHQHPPPDVYPFLATQDFGELRRPGRPIPKIAGSRLADFRNNPFFPLYFLTHVQEGQPVRLNGAASVFATEFSWSFEPLFPPSVASPPISDPNEPHASFELDTTVSSDINSASSNPEPKPYYLRFGVTNEFASYNEIVQGQLFSDSRLKPLSFTENIYELLTTNFSFTNSPGRPDGNLSCRNCHSSGIPGDAHRVFDLFNNSIPDEATQQRFAYFMTLTRVDCNDPDNSLILRKPAQDRPVTTDNPFGGLPHYGGKYFVFSGSSFGLVKNTGDDDARARMLRWIMEGALFAFAGPGQPKILGCPPPARLRPVALTRAAASVSP